MTFQRLKRLHRWCECILILLAATSVGAADHPEQDDRLAARTGVEFQPRLGEYHYEIRWARQRVATGMIAVRKDGDQYILTADQRTTKAIDRIYRVRYRGETRIHAADLSPSESVIKEEVKKRRKTQRATYDTVTGAVTVEETRSRKKKPAVERKIYELRSDTGILDVFSAIFMARSFDWSIGERHTFQVFIGEKQYAVAMVCIGTSTFEIDGDRIPVWVIRPEIRKTTDAKLSSVGRKTRIFIAADDSKDVVKIEAQPGIGTVTLQLVEYREH